MLGVGKAAHSIRFAHSPLCLIANSRIRSYPLINRGHDLACGQRCGDYWLIVLLLRAGVAPAYIRLYIKP